MSTTATATNETVDALLHQIRLHGGKFTVKDGNLAYSGTPLTDALRAAVKKEKYAIMHALVMAEAKPKPQPPTPEMQPGEWDRNRAIDILSEVCRRFESAANRPWWQEKHAKIANALAQAAAVFLFKKDATLWTVVSEVGNLLERWAREGNAPADDGTATEPASEDNGLADPEPGPAGKEIPF